jgi:PAS domain S-box-containing protein
MSETRSDPLTNDRSPRRVYVALALAAVVLIGALISILRMAATAREVNRLQGMLAATLVVVLALAGYVAYTFQHYLRRRKRVEEALRESEEKYRGLYESSSDAVMLLDEKRFLDCNESTLRVFRVNSKEEFCRKHPADVSPPLQPGGRDSMELANEQIMTALRDGSNRFEWVHRRSDGELFPAEVVLSPTHFEGRLVLQALVRDETLRKQAEGQLRANEEKLRTISEAALDAVIMMDSAGCAVHWNPAAQRMFGYAAEEVLGRDIHQLLTPARFHEEAARALGSFIHTGQGQAVGRILELLAVRKDGQEFPIEISLAPIRLEGEWNAVALVRDITERKQAEQALRHEQRSLRRLLRAHDQERKLIAYEIHDGLAQQLVAAIYACQAAERNTETASEKAAATLHELHQLLRRCLAETRRLISGVRPPILDEFGVVTAVQGLIEDTLSRGGPHIEFRHNVQFQRLEPILENTIYRIIQEGLANACRHGHSPEVLIELTETDQEVEIRVQDYGVGFDPEKIDEKRFGLAGIRERARLLRGRVTLESAPGEGTSLQVRLPKDVGDLADSV